MNSFGNASSVRSICRAQEVGFAHFVKDSELDLKGMFRGTQSGFPFGGCLRGVTAEEKMLALLVIFTAVAGCACVVQADAGAPTAGHDGPAHFAAVPAQAGTASLNPASQVNSTASPVKATPAATGKSKPYNRTSPEPAAAASIQSSAQPASSTATCDNSVQTNVSLKSQPPKLAPTVAAGIQDDPAEVNPTAFAAEFFDNVSVARDNVSVASVAHYAECPSLDNLSTIRFVDMTEGDHYLTTHYGFFPDVYGFLNGAYKYSTGGILGEEALYPGGSSPSEFLSYMDTAAPLHYDLLMKNYAYYGFHIAQGPMVEAFNCSVTETPTGGINVTQYATERGCDVGTAKVTWFVINLADHCAPG